MKIVKKIAVWIPAVLIMVMIFLFSNQNGDDSMGVSYKVSEILVKIADAIHLIDMKWNEQAHAIEQMQTPVRKLAHMAEFGLLAFAVYSALKYDGFPYKLTKYLTFIIVVGFAALDEFHQLWITGRDGNPTDVLIDACGCIIIVFLCTITDKRKNLII